MEELLEFLYNNLSEQLNSFLKGKEKKYDENNNLDVLNTVLTLSKTQKELIRLFESSAVEKSVLIYQFSKISFEECIKSKFIRQGSTINDTKYFIGMNGLYHFYLSQNKSIIETFVSLDETRFKNDEISLKIQEKIWCIFLLLFGADSVENKLDTTILSHVELERLFNFLITIEKVLVTNGIKLGRSISWGTGKDKSFRSFITNNVLLPKTGIYFDRPTNNYFLDLTKRKNAIYLIDLILDNYDGAEKILAKDLFKNSLRELSNIMLIDLSIIPKELNQFIITEL
jgi:hypothetical protein